MKNSFSLSQFISSNSFLWLSITTVFAASIFLRSMFDIGPDTGIYLSLGKKIANGGKYYYDFFESNFPLSFYFYALQYKLSLFLKIDPIITCEIVINSLALLSLFWCSKILKRTTIADNKAHYNLILLSYFLGFFLRPEGLYITEFGTKTSLFLLCLFPYISLSFQRKYALTTKEYVGRGVVMALSACLKPHYLIVIVVIEIYQFLKIKSLTFFLELDKLVMLLLGLFYLVLMFAFTPEFFEFMVPMWSKFYASYSSTDIFYQNLPKLFSSKVIIFAFIFLIFTHLKMSENDKILALFFFGVCLLILAENLGTVDQEVVAYCVFTICFSKFIYDLALSHNMPFKDHRFVILSVMIIPIFDIENLPWVLFSVAGFVNIWWLAALVYPYFFYKKLQQDHQTSINLKHVLVIYFIMYVILALLTVLAAIYVGTWGFICLNLTSLWIILFLFERFYATLYDKYSHFSVFIIVSSISSLVYLYISSLIFLFNNSGSFYRSPNHLSKNIVNYSKIYAPKQRDNIMVFTDMGMHHFPILNYLQKDNPYPFFIVSLNSTYGYNGHIYPDVRDEGKLFLFYYLFDHLKKTLRDENTKLIFISSKYYSTMNENRCMIGYLQYYFLDPYFRKIFLENFKYQSRIVVTNNDPQYIHQIDHNPQEEVVHDFEVYVRKSQ